MEHALVIHNYAKSDANALADEIDKLSRISDRKSVVERFPKSHNQKPKGWQKTKLGGNNVNRNRN